MVALCEDCESPQAEIGDVITGAELLCAITELAARDEVEFEANAVSVECVVYMMSCPDCGWQSMRSTERIKLAEDPEPIG